MGIVASAGDTCSCYLIINVSAAIPGQGNRCSGCDAVRNSSNRMDGGRVTGRGADMLCGGSR